MSDRQYTMQVTVQSRYLPEQSNPERRLYSFAYTIRIRNAGNVPAQLISRHWLITDADGKVIEVKGLGVVGQQPLLAPGEDFEYTSGCQLATPTGGMRGSYFCVAEDTAKFDVEISEFSLSMPRALH